ncbi:hypothetical protein ACLESO_19340, partial [Pyxidicoccus sp. 3LG]
MRSHGPTSRMHGTGRAALWLLLSALVGAVLTLALTGDASERGGSPGVGRPAHGVKAVVGHEPVMLSARPERRQPCVRFHGAGFDTWAAVRGAAATQLAHAA